jgi:hypothetical protein
MHVSIDCVFEVAIGWDWVLVDIDFLFFCRNDEWETLSFLHRLDMTPPRYDSLTSILSEQTFYLGTFSQSNKLFARKWRCSHGLYIQWTPLAPYQSHRTCNRQRKPGELTSAGVSIQYNTLLQ